MARRRTSILEDIQQTRPFGSKEQEALVTLLHTADRAKNRYADLFEREDVTFQQYNVLRILRGAGLQGLPTLEIGERMVEKTPGVTRIVDRLERKGWVQRDRGTEDRRRVWCRITPTGLELLERLDGPVDRTDEQIFSSLSAAEVQTLIDLLNEVRGRMGEAGD